MDEETIKEWHEGWIKDCPNGKLDPKTFVAMYKEFFPTGPNAENFCTHVYRYVNYYFYVAFKLDTLFDVILSYSQLSVSVLELEKLTSNET